MIVSKRAFLRGLSANWIQRTGKALASFRPLEPRTSRIRMRRRPSSPTPGMREPPCQRPEPWLPAPQSQGWVFVMGGLREGGASDDNEFYDPFTDHWQKAAPLPQPLLNAAAVGADGVIYLFGGFDQEVRPSPDAWRYDPATDSWEQLRPLPTPRGGLGTAILGRNDLCSRRQRRSQRIPADCARILGCWRDAKQHRGSRW